MRPRPCPVIDTGAVRSDAAVIVPPAPRVLAAPPLAPLELVAPESMLFVSMTGFTVAPSDARSSTMMPLTQRSVGPHIRGSARKIGGSRTRHPRGAASRPRP